MKIYMNIYIYIHVYIYIIYIYIYIYISIKDIYQSKICQSYLYFILT